MRKRNRVHLHTVVDYLPITRVVDLFNFHLIHSGVNHHSGPFIRASQEKHEYQVYRDSYACLSKFCVGQCLTLCQRRGNNVHDRENPAYYKRAVGEPLKYACKGIPRLGACRAVAGSW